MTFHQTSGPDISKMLPKQLGATVNYAVTLSGATRVVEEKSSSARVGVMANSLAGKTHNFYELPVFLLTESLGLLTDAQLDLVQEAERVTDKFVKGHDIALMKKLFRTGHSQPLTYPHDFLVSCIIGGFSETALRHIIDFAYLGESIPAMVRTCFALTSAGVEVTEGNIRYHLEFLKQLQAVSRGWVNAENDGPQFHPDVVLVVRENPDRMDDILSYFKDRGETLQGIREYLSADKPLASGML